MSDLPSEILNDHRRWATTDWKLNPAASRPQQFPTERAGLEALWNRLLQLKDVRLSDMAYEPDQEATECCNLVMQSIVIADEACKEIGFLTDMDSESNWPSPVAASLAIQPGGQKGFYTLCNTIYPDVLTVLPKARPPRCRVQLAIVDPSPLAVPFGNACQVVLADAPDASREQRWFSR